MPFDKQGNWRPTPKQTEFLCLPETVKEGFFGGGAGSGKSEILLAYPLARKWYMNPRFKQVFMRRTYVELRNEIVPRSREFYLKFGAKFNKSEMSWCFPREDQYGSGAIPNGSMIYLAHCETEDDVHKFDSMEINLYTPDELTSYTEWIYLYITFSRLRTSDPELPAIARASGMPGNIGHSWVNNRFVKPNKVDGRIISNRIIVGRGGNKRSYIHATAADNANVDPNYQQSLDALPEAERKAKKFGDWDSYLGSVFNEFRDRKYPNEPDNALHVVPSFAIPDWWPKIVVIDWGYKAMTYVSYSAISPDRRVYTYREQFWYQTKIEIWAPFVKEHCDREFPRIVKMCQSASQDRGQEHTILQQVTDALNRPVILSGNTAGSRVAGKILMHEYLRWEPKYQPFVPMVYNEEHAMWLYRNRGEREYRSYLNSFNEPEPESNLPKWIIFEECVKLIEAIKACSYDKKKVEDVAPFEGDDPYDNARYLLDTVDRFFDEAKDEMTKVQQKEHVLHYLNESNDWTAFYRNMKKIEGSDNVVSVRRYR